MAAIVVIAPLKNLVPLAEDQVRGDGDRLLLVALGEEGEQDLHFLAGLLHVADIVEDDDVPAFVAAVLKTPDFAYSFFIRWYFCSVIMGPRGLRASPTPNQRRSNITSVRPTRVPPTAIHAYGATVHLAFAPEKLYLFDAEEETALV